MASRRHPEDPQAALSLRKSSGKNTRLTRRLEEVGWDDPVSLWIYSTSQIVLPILTASAVLVVLGIPNGLLLALIMGFVGYMIPDVVVSRRIAQRRRAFATDCRTHSISSWSVSRLARASTKQF